MIYIYAKKLTSSKALKAKQWLDERHIKSSIFDFDDKLHSNIVHNFFLTRENCPFFFVQQDNDSFVEFVKDFKTLKNKINKKEKEKNNGNIQL